MRKLPFLLVLLLLSLLLLAAAASAHALSLTAPPAVTGVVSQVEDEEDGEGEGEEAGVSEADEEGFCGAAEEACEEGEGSEREGCALQGAVASMSLAPSVDQVRLTVRYRASEPTVVVLSSRLRGARGALHLGTDRARFSRRGTYRDSFQLAPGQMPKALGARELDVDLHALGTPAACALRLATRAPHRAR